MDEVEKKTILDRINFSAEVRTRFDWFTYKDNTDPSATVDDNSDLHSTRFRLNLKADVSENLKFHSRLSMLNNFNDADSSTAISMNPSRVRGDNNLKVERAYTDYFFDFMPAALTIGRLPMSDGLPTNLREDTCRKSTYPAIAYDLESDGLALSFFLHDWVPLPSPALRLIYMESTKDEDNVYKDNTLDSGDLDIYVGQLETGLTGLEDTIFIFNYILIPHVEPTGTDTLAANMGLAAGTLTGDLPDSLGRIHTYCVYIQSERFLGSRVDWFAGYRKQVMKPKGAPARYFSGGVLILTRGLGSTDNSSKRTANCYHVGARINLTIKKLNNPKFGIEYNKASQYAIPTNYAAEDPLHKLDVPGEVWDFYYIQPIDKNFSIRAGYTKADYDYDSSNWYFGDRTEIDREITNTYILLDMKI